MNLINQSLGYGLIGLGYVIYNITYFLLPSNYNLVYSSTYPYPNYYNNEQLNIANKIWNRLSYYEKADFVWHNTYIFIPNAPGNPYTIGMYKNRIEQN